MRDATYQIDEDGILDSTFNYLVKHGLENTTVRELCKGTGIADKRNSSGEKYRPCQLCCKDNEKPVTAFYTDYGNRYHSQSLCSNLHSNVFSVDKETAQENYRLCSKCEKRKWYGKWNNYDSAYNRVNFGY